MATQAYVTQQYRELLGRDPDAGGLKHYMGYSDPNAVRNSILGSTEYRSRQAASAPASAPDPGAAQRAALEQEVSGLFAESGNLYNNMRNPVEVYNAALESLGLADARTRVSSLREQLMNSESLLRNVAGDVQARTQDFNVSENQRRRLTAAESEPLAGQVDVMSRALEGALGDYNTLLGEGRTQAELTFQGDREKRQALMDRLQTAISRSNSAEDKRRWETELQRLRDKDAEEVRQFNANLALEQQKAATAARSGGSSKSSNAANQTAAQQQVSSYIMGNGVRGRDGYISPPTYKQLKSEWVAAGYPANTFDTNFKQYANPTHLRDYGL